MGRPAALALLILAAGCSGGEAPKSSEEAKKDILAPTDVSKLTPAQQKAVAGFAKANATGAKGP